VVSNPPPAVVVAEFAGAPTNGVAPLTVAFTNLSSSATNYTWTFGDGKSSAVVNPSNTYSNAGTYSVTLAAVGAGGTNVSTRTNYIVVTNPSPLVASFRWASSSQRIYVTGPGSATLSQIKAAVPSAPLTLVDPANAVWYLGANLFVENGAQLNLHGPVIGGDVAELRLKSDNTTAANAIVELRVDWGRLDIRNTKIMSWDNAVNGPDTETDTYRRAYVRARSTLDPDGVTAHESRMDVINSEICYLGSHNSEAYGLTWKVVDTTAVYLPPGSTNTLFDVVNVYGDILNSRLHHNFFGMYSYGHYGGHWATNEVDHNVAYGFDPHDDSDYLVIENNNVHHNGWHGIIASKRCDHGVMRSNVSWNNGLDLVDPHGHGIMLHRSCNDWLVEDNQSSGNADTGIAIFASDGILIRNNCCLSNANAGIRLSVGSANNWVEGNEIGGAHRYGFYLFDGDDDPEPDDTGGLESGRCHGNTFTNNFLHDYTSDAIKLQDSDSNVFLANVFIGSSTTLRFERGTNNLVIGNIVPDTTLVKLIGASTNLTSTTFKSQPRLTFQLDPYSKATFADDEGVIFDFDQDVVTVADGAGSFVIVTSAQVGTGANTVLTRNFFVVPDSAGVLVNPTTWNQSGTFSKAWTAQASSGSIQVNYVVGDLQPGVSYRVNQGSTLLATITANALGYISFTTIPGTTTTLTYSVSPS
jgi:parallel beta-helix repeat protein